MIGDAIYTIFSQDATIAGLVSTRIYPDIATQTAAYPFIVYGVEGTEPSDTKDGVSRLDVVTVSVMVYAKSYSTAGEIASACRSAFDRYSGSAAGENIQSVRFVNQMSHQMELDKHIFIVEQNYNVRLLL